MYKLPQLHGATLAHGYVVLYQSLW